MAKTNSPALLPEESAASSGTDRTLAILEVLSSHGHAGMTIAEISRALDLPQNSVFRIVDTLHERGYVERDSGRRYVLTGKLLDVAKPKVGDKSLAACAFDALCELRNVTGETAQLAVRSQQRCVLLEQVASRHPVKVLGELGLRIPLYSCAPGKAMLAALPPSELDEFYQSVTLKRFTPTTLSTRKALNADLSSIRVQGYSLDRAEGLEGIHCVGAAILDGNDYPVAALTVIGPAFRLREEHFIAIGAQCLAAAQTIRNRLLA